MAAPRGPRDKAFDSFERWKKKKGPTALARAKRHRALTAQEQAAKATVRDRDRVCRFPLCGCRASGDVNPMKRVLTVSHDQHKGMGGNPDGERSQPEFLLLLCKWRHQDAPVSRHAGTLRTRYLSDAKNNGPLAFEVDLWAAYPGLYSLRGAWREVARETAIGVLDDTTIETSILDDLQEMDR
jgi:hypothetical protein